MAITEGVTIAFQATGIPTIKRQIDAIGEAANNASRGFFLLQRALYTLGGFGLARILTGSLDALTNMENRLKLTTHSTYELNKVQKELFEIAKRSRSSWEGVSEIYNRAALSAKALGIAQKDVLIFTEGVAKAAAVSGAGTQEARAALIQLGQAVASNRLGGDELRSVLEQLPFAADVIAEYMTKTGEYGEVTRGNIRQLGKEGKITARVIVEAFKSAEGELADLFAKMPTTIGQALEIARTNFMQFLDEFDDTTGFSDKVAKSITVIGENIWLAVKAATALAGVFAVGLFGRMANSLGNFTNSIKANIVQQNALKRAQVGNNAYLAEQARSTLAAVTANRAQYTQNLALIAQKKILLQQQIQEAQFGVRNGAARNLQTGQYVSLAAAKANLVALGGRLQALEALEAAEAARLAAARAAQVGATNTYAAALARLQAAQASATLGSRVMAAASVALTASMSLLKNAATSLFLFMGGVPGILLAAAAAIAYLVMSSESAAEKFERLSQSTAGSDSSITAVKDAQVALNEAIAQMGNVSNVATEQLIADSQEILMARLALLELDRDKLIALQAERQLTLDNLNAQLTALNSTAVALQEQVTLREKLGKFKEAEGWKAQLEKVKAEIKAIQDQAKGLGAEFTITGNQIQKMTASISSGYSDVLKKAGGIVDRTTAFAAKLLEAVRNGQAFSGLNMSGAVTPAVSAAQRLIDKLIAGINLIRQAIGLAGTAGPAGAPGPGDMTSSPIPPERPNDIDFGIPDEPKGGGGGGGGGGGEPAATFESELAELQKKIDLERQYGIQKEANNTILGIEEKIKRSLSAVEKEQISNTTRLLEIAKMQGAILEEVNGPQEQLRIGQQALNELFNAGAISLEIYTAKLRDLNVAAMEASGTLAGGFKAAIGSAVMSASELGQALGDWVVGAANSAADAIVNFAQTGEFNVKQFFNQLFAQLLKLAAQQLLLRFISGFLGIPVPGLGGGGSTGGIPGMASGGSISPSGPGSTDSQLIAFKKRPDERVDVLTPGQQAAQRNRMNRKSSDGGSSQPTINQKIVNVLDPSIVGAYLKTADGETTFMNLMARSGVLDRGRA